MSDPTPPKFEAEEQQAAYAEALRRIQAAKASGQTYLDLGDINNLAQLPPEIGELKDLRVLRLGEWLYDEKEKEWKEDEEDPRWYFRRLLVDLTPLQGLRFLQSLDVSNTHISDLTPLKGVSSLQSLVLSTTEIKDLAQLQCLTSLQSLYVSNTWVNDLKPIQCLTSLRSLSVSNTQISDFTPLHVFGSLQSLDVSLTRINDLAPLQGLSSLQSLNVSCTQVNDLTPLQRLNTLQSLYAGDTQVNDLTPLKDLRSLQSLDVSDTQINDLTPLKNLSSLQSLDVSSTQVNDLTPLQGLNSLQSLDVSSTQVNDLTPLQGLNSLQSLDLSSTQVNDLTPLQGLNSLQSLNVSSTQVNDLTPLKGLSSLLSLSANSTQVNDLTPLKSLSSLQSVFVADTQVNDLTPLESFSSLQTLYVGHTQISDLTPLQGLGSLQSLYVNGTHVSDLTPLQELGSLEWLNLSSTQVSDLTPLQGLGSLQSLDVSSTKLNDLTPLHELSSLYELTVSSCHCMSTWESLRGHPALERLRVYPSAPCRLSPDVLESLTSLAYLCVDRVVGAPPEVLSNGNYNNCLPTFRSWYADLQNGEEKDQEVKLFVLGNGTAGKTQICRQLLGLPFDDKIPSTHGVQIGGFEIAPDKGEGAIRARLWDFGGQDIYHGTHALFLEGRAVFLLVWNPEVEGAGDYEESGLSLHHHGLGYWLDYVRSLAGEDAAVVIVQAKCDRESDRIEAPLPPVKVLKRPLQLVTCSAKTGEIDELKAAIRAATRYLLEQHGSYRLPSSWVAVRDELRKLKLAEKTLSRARFDELCKTTHGPSVPAAVLSYLHRSGELFHREGLFRDEIVLDQEWAVRAIYAVLDRQGPCQGLRQFGGHFTLPLLDSLVWRGEFTAQEQETILGMMQSCAICFPLDPQDRYSIPTTMRRYAAPDLLPSEAEAQGRISGLWRSDIVSHKVTLEYTFLHEGILRQILCQIGRLAGPDAAYWRYGCCFYDGATHSCARIRAEFTPTTEAPARGRITIETCEGRARELLAALQKAVMNIRIGQPPQVIGEDEQTGAAPAETAAPTKDLPLEQTLKPAPIPLDPASKIQVWLSYGWGANDALVDRLETCLIGKGYDVRRDNHALRPGDRLLDFEREIGRGAHVIVMLSTKYLTSPHCMRELLYLHNHSQGDKTDFLKRVVPVVLEDVKINDDEQRLDHVIYWVNKRESLDKKMATVPRAALGSTPQTLALIDEFCNYTQPILSWLADVLMPRRIAEVEKDNFAAVLEALGK